MTPRESRKKGRDPLLTYLSSCPQANISAMSGFSSVLLREEKENILSLWAQRSINEVPSAATGAPLALRDSLPLYLDHLSDALATNRRMDFKSVFIHDQEGIRIGKLHGADRASNRSYVLTEVIFEYHILRECIFNVLEKKRPLPVEQRDIIYDSIEQAVNDAAVEFSEVHADIQQKFINTLTHDLKNPITAAKINAQLISRRTDTPETAINSAKKVIGSLNRLEAMIHDLLDASRVRAGERLSLQFVECDLEMMIQEIVDEMSIIHANPFNFNSMGKASGTWGRDGLRRAVENLVGNAIKYGLPLAPVTITLQQTDLAVQIAVHNQGSPIPQNEIRFLFQQYQRSKTAQEGPKPGWGLGLTLVKGVADAHQGTIHVESSEHVGTTFKLEMPFAQSNVLPVEKLTGPTDVRIEIVNRGEVPPRPGSIRK